MESMVEPKNDFASIALAIPVNNRIDSRVVVWGYHLD